MATTSSSNVRHNPIQWSLRVITGLTADTEPSIVLKVDTPAKYIFNIPEGTNRACTQKRFPVSKTKAAFLTRLHPEQLGGFPGVVMTLADMNTRDLTVCGSPGLTHYLASTRFYSRRTELGVNVNEYKPPDQVTAGDATSSSAPPPPIYQDENIVVHSIPLYPSAAVEDDLSFNSPSSSIKRKRSSSATPPPSPKRRSTETSPASHQADLSPPPPIASKSLSQEDADHLHRQQMLHLMFRPPASSVVSAAPVDDMQLDKATDPDPQSFLKVPSDLKHLWNQRLPKFHGTPQTLAYFVVGPATRGKFDAKRAKELGVAGAMCGKLTKGETVTTPSGNVVTPDMCLGPSIPPPAFLFIHAPDPSYIDSVLSQAESGRFLPSTYGSTVQLHAIIHRVGPGVLEDERYRQWMSSFDPAVNHMVSSESYSPNSITYSSSARMQLELSYLDNEIFKLPHHSDTPLASLSSLPGLPPKTAILAQDTEISMHPRLDPCPASIVPPDDFKATLDAIKAGSYVHPLEDAYKLAREDAQRSAPTNSSQSGGQDVTITTLGTGSAMPSKYRNVSATLIQIPNYGNILLDAGEGTWGQLARQFGPPSDDGDDASGVTRILRDLNGVPAMLKATLGLDSIEAVDVEHRVQCFGLVVRHKDGWSVVYSGDTMPCDRLVEAGQDATVLIHEATMADDQADLAFVKAHSTAGQAIDIGRRMNAKNILLTHFSQRYPKMPEIQAPDVADEALLPSSHEPRAPVAIAFDCAALKLGSLWKMEKYMGAMAKTFEKEPNEEEVEELPAQTEALTTSPTPTKSKKNKKDKRSTANAA
ncbi:hypothetical protein FRB90_002586 [Tulasnella sp. 427]|nr:hypothetical protein FRB90_002586 [Tulasnella sp. 427]